MDRRAAWILGTLFGGLFLLMFGFLFLLFLSLKGEGKGASSLAVAGGSRVGVVEIIGPIVDSKKTVRQLQEFKEASQIKAIVVRIDSPGGAVGPSQEIYSAIRRLKDRKKVVASMGSVAASGGYYIACAADRIFANPGTLTGSIGVVFELPNVEGLMRWAGVEMRTLTSGKMKDSGSPFRAMTADEKGYFEGLLADVHQQFISDVAKGRGLSVEQVRRYADGRVFTGRQAKEWKLVDELGGLTEAVASAANLAGMAGEPKIEYPKKDRHWLVDLVGEDTEALWTGMLRSASDHAQPGLKYQLP